MSFDERILNGMGVMTAIVDSGSFAGAAERLDMSQSGVSRSVARLEARLGIRLFDRTTRTVTLTDEGRRFYAQVVPLLDGLEDAASSAAGGASAVRGRLRVNVDPFFSKIVLSPRIGQFIERYPELDVDLFTRDALGDIEEARTPAQTRRSRTRTASVHSLSRPGNGAAVRVGVSPAAQETRDCGARTADGERCLDHARRVSGGPRHCADHGARHAAAVRQRQTRRSVSRLARRALSALRALSVAAFAVRESAGVSRLHRRHHGRDLERRAVVLNGQLFSRLFNRLKSPAKTITYCRSIHAPR